MLSKLWRTLENKCSVLVKVFDAEHVLDHDYFVALLSDSTNLKLNQKGKAWIKHQSSLHPTEVLNDNYIEFWRLIW